MTCYNESVPLVLVNKAGPHDEGSAGSASHASFRWLAHPITRSSRGQDIDEDAKQLVT